MELEQLFELEIVGNHFLRVHDFGLMEPRCTMPAIPREENDGCCNCESAQYLRRLWKTIRELAEARRHKLVAANDSTGR